MTDQMSSEEKKTDFLKRCCFFRKKGERERKKPVNHDRSHIYIMFQWYHRVVNEYKLIDFL
jgi:hypothetical protein